MLLQASSPNIISMQQHTAYPFLGLGNLGASQISLKIGVPDTDSVFGKCDSAGHASSEVACRLDPLPEQLKQISAASEASLAEAAEKEKQLKESLPPNSAGESADWP